MKEHIKFYQCHISPLSRNRELSSATPVLKELATSHDTASAISKWLRSFYWQVLNFKFLFFFCVLKSRAQTKRLFMLL